MKYSVGEVVWVRSSVSRFEGWREMEVLDICETYADHQSRYNDRAATTDLRFHPLPWYRTSELLFTSEPYMRKKHPPQQDTQIAEDWFIQDFNKIFDTEEVKV